jgi:polyisoprenoid-binding protein YceI
MKKTILLMAVAISSVAAFAQKKTTTSGTIAFDATTTLDALPKAENKTVIAAIDTKAGTVLFEALVKSFSFANPMMQEHFNSPKWFDSDKDPKASFSGTITNLKDVNFKKDGIYKATVEGDLTLKGITNKVSTIATIEVKGKSLYATADFTIKLVDYNIADAKGKLASEPKITVTAVLN